MTTAREIVKQGYRESNLLSIGFDPSTDQNTEGLDKLRKIIAGVFGFKGGVLLKEWPIGNEGVADVAVNWSRNDWQLPPPNVRMMVSSTEPETITLPSFPDNGARIGVIDLTGGMSGYPMVIDPQNKLIEGTTSVTIMIDGANLEWMYRADLGDWRRLTLINLDDEMPFPLQFDPYFETALAMRLNPRYGRAIQQESATTMQETLSMLRATYRQTRSVRAPEEVLRMSDTGRGSLFDDVGAAERSDLWLNR